MSDATVASMRKIVAGAAHGAWIALLIGVMLTMVSWAVFAAMATFAPDLITTLTATPVRDIWALTLRWYAGLKLLLLGWALFASFLSYWWRAL